MIMPVTTLSGREFNADIGRAKRAASSGPVVITDRGRPTYVLQTYEDWRKQTGSAPGCSLLDALADPKSEDIEFEPPRLSAHFHPAELA
jgi:hypothetical protein